MEFEWDSVKADTNLIKHHIDFVDAITIFNDPRHILLDSTKPEHGEIRKKAIGRTSDGRLVTVVFTDRGEVRRVISARKVRKNERQQYDQGQDFA